MRNCLAHRQRQFINSLKLAMAIVFSHANQNQLVIRFIVGPLVIIQPQMEAPIHRPRQVPPRQQSAAVRVHIRVPVIIAV